MYKRFSLLLTIAIGGTLLLPVACSNKNNFTGDHLSPKVMQAVLLDISLAESYSIMVKDSLHKGGSKNWDSLGVYYKDIFAHYKITPEQFTASLDWYKSHINEMDSLFNKMTPIITEWQTRPEKSRN